MVVIKGYEDIFVQNKDLSKTVDNILNKAYSEKNVYPKREDVFNAFKLCPLDKVKVVILGQDPYHKAGLADGLAFSVGSSIALPSSLRNIFKELSFEYGESPRKNGDLSDWASQGVLLLNTVLTVKENIANSHRNLGWDKLSDEIIKYIGELKRPIVYMLWGNYARQKAKLIVNKKHLILEAVHPSGLSANRGFFNCGHFKKANEYLSNNNMKEIKWI